MITSQLCFQIVKYFCQQLLITNLCIINCDTAVWVFPKLDFSTTLISGGEFPLTCPPGQSPFYNYQLESTSILSPDKSYSKWKRWGKDKTWGVQSGSCRDYREYWSTTILPRLPACVTEKLTCAKISKVLSKMDFPRARKWWVKGMCFPAFLKC